MKKCASILLLMFSLLAFSVDAHSPEVVDTINVEQVDTTTLEVVQGAEMHICYKINNIIQIEANNLSPGTFKTLKNDRYHSIENYKETHFNRPLPAFEQRE
jgi:hypothetical protein